MKREISTSTNRCLSELSTISLIVAAIATSAILWLIIYAVI